MAHQRIEDSRTAIQPTQSGLSIPYPSERIWRPLWLPLMFVACLVALPEKPLLAQNRAIAVVIRVEHPVEVRRFRQENYSRLKLGDELFRGDSVRAAQGATAELRCTSNSLIWTVPADSKPRSVAEFCP